jgi:signal peptidase I
MTALSQEACKCSLAAEVLQSTGRLQLRASGISMLPTLWPGDCLTIQSHSFEQVQPGDLVLYARSGRLFIHRVMRKCRIGEEHCLIARGDCMTEDDPPIHETDLLGKVTLIHRRNTRIVPGLKMPPARLLTAWLLCHWDLLLRATLRVHVSFEWSCDRSRA